MRRWIHKDLYLGKEYRCWSKRVCRKRLDEAQYPVKAYRTLIAILSLAKLYGKIELNLALAYALKIDAKSVKSIESILSKNYI